MYLVYGHGINNRRYPTKIKGVRTKEYDLWRGIIQRCYDKKVHDKFSTYIGCTASAEFLRYDYFHEWCQDQIGFNVDGFNLDKDLIKKNNKLYSQDTCLFIPQEINNLLTKANASRNGLYIGVHFCNTSQRYVSSIRKKDKSVTLGYFKDPLKAHLLYKDVKEDYIKDLAEEYKSVIDVRAYQAMIDYRVDIDD